jgi:aarF domain-containing kinase
MFYVLVLLQASPTYSIVSECMPYLSRRLLTDNDPRMRAALKHLLYGNKKRLDLERLVKIMTAFGSFSTAGEPCWGC